MEKNEQDAEIAAGVQSAIMTERDKIAPCVHRKKFLKLTNINPRDVVFLSL